LINYHILVILSAFNKLNKEDFMKKGKKVSKLRVLVLLSALSLGVILPGMALAAPSAAQAQMVNINRASSEELQTLRGVGPALAARIVNYRDENGTFETLEDLQAVKGIGTAKFNKIKGSIKL